MNLAEITKEFAAGFVAADALRPSWTSRSGRQYQPGLGPHAEDAAVGLVLDQMRKSPSFAGVPIGQSLPYPSGGRQRCDVWVGDPCEWAIEVKMARFWGDNGKRDDTAIKDILSPYSSDRSALTDTTKLAEAGFECNLAVLIYGFTHGDLMLEPVVHSFEVLARDRVELGSRHEAPLAGLVHPVHAEGSVFAWEVRPR